MLKLKSINKRYLINLISNFCNKSYNLAMNFMNMFLQFLPIFDLAFGDYIFFKSDKSQIHTCLSSDYVIRKKKHYEFELHFLLRFPLRFSKKVNGTCNLAPFCPHSPYCWAQGMLPKVRWWAPKSTVVRHNTVWNRDIVVELNYDKLLGPSYFQILTYY